MWLWRLSLIISIIYTVSVLSTMYEYMYSQTELEGMHRVSQGRLQVPSNQSRFPAVYTTSTPFRLSYYTPCCRVYCMHPAHTTVQNIYCSYPVSLICGYPVAWLHIYCRYTAYCSVAKYPAHEYTACKLQVHCTMQGSRIYCVPLLLWATWSVVPVYPACGLRGLCRVLAVYTVQSIQSICRVHCIYTSCTLQFGLGYEAVL